MRGRRPEREALADSEEGANSRQGKAEHRQRGGYVKRGAVLSTQDTTVSFLPQWQMFPDRHIWGSRPGLSTTTDGFDTQTAATYSGNYERLKSLEGRAERPVSIIWLLYALGWAGKPSIYPTRPTAGIDSA